jgi:hypothetical protein
MSTLALFFALAAIEVAGLFIIWFRLRARVRRFLELDNLLEGVREEARALVLELNETADRNVSLVEDRIVALRELLAELDRRIVVEKRELETRSVEREVYAKLARRRPIVPAEEPALPESAPPSRRAVHPAPQPAPHPASQAPVPQELPREAAREIAREAVADRTEDGPIPLPLGSSSDAIARRPFRSAPEVTLSDDLIINSKTKREEALELHRSGISADLIAARLGATVAEIELLVELEERRAEAEIASRRGEGLR